MRCIQTCGFILPEFLWAVFLSSWQNFRGEAAKPLAEAIEAPSGVGTGQFHTKAILAASSVSLPATSSHSSPSSHAPAKISPRVGKDAIPVLAGQGPAAGETEPVGGTVSGIAPKPLTAGSKVTPTPPAASLPSVNDPSAVSLDRPSEAQVPVMADTRIGDFLCRYRFMIKFVLQSGVTAYVVVWSVLLASQV